MRRGRVAGAWAVAVLGPATMAGAALMEVTPFSGTSSETWESFDNYTQTPGLFLDDPTIIMGGDASISNLRMAVYEPGVAPWGLGINFAGVSDGERAMGADEADAVVDIDFLAPVTSFGAYWAVAFGGDVTVRFYDTGGGLIDEVAFTYDEVATGGGLAWHGWESDAAIGRIEYEGDFVAIDGLQANGVPTPGVLPLLGLAALLDRRRRRRA